MPKRDSLTYGGLKKKQGFHRHHIVPIHAGGKDTKENVCYLTAEDHAKEHLALYENHGKLADLAAAEMIEKRFISGAYSGSKWYINEDGQRLRSKDHPGIGWRNQFCPKHNGKTTVGRKWFHCKISGAQKMLFERPESWSEGRLPGSVNPNKGHVWWYHEVSKKETHKATCPGPGWIKGKLTNFFLDKAQ